MALGVRIPWVFKNHRFVTPFTGIVLSASINVGRGSYMDVYNGGSLVLTVNNNTDQTDNFRMNDRIQVTDGSFGYDQTFWVDEIQYQDYPGNTGLSTMTVTCSDAVTRLGRRFVDGQILPEESAADQIARFDSFGFPPQVVTVGEGSIVSGTTYTGAPMQRINQIVSTDRGMLNETQLSVRYVAHDSIASGNPLSSIAIGRTTASNRIGYQEFTRTALGLNFMNTVTVSPDGGSEQVAENTSSATLYGSAFYSVSSLDATDTQALNLAQWLSNVQSDPTAVRFEIGFSDRSQDDAAMIAFVFDMQQQDRFNLSYRVPGAVSDVTTEVIVEGYSVNITPAESVFRVSFSPMAYYQFFTLDSATLGVLDSSKLGF
jgi:hypothetical protein